MFGGLSYTGSVQYPFGKPPQTRGEYNTQKAWIEKAKKFCDEDTIGKVDKQKVSNPVDLPEDQLIQQADDIASAAKSSVDDFISTRVNSNFQTNVKNAFGSDVKVTILSEDKVVYRYHGGGSGGTSYWYTPNKTSNPAADLALPAGNTYQYVDTHIIPKGTEVLEGTVASNFGQPGGGYQYYVPDPSVVK